MQSISRSQGNALGRNGQKGVYEAQDLLKSVRDEGASKIDDVKAKVGAQYDVAREKFGEIQATVQDDAKYAMTTTDEYVRGNPWRAVGIAAAVGAVVGFLAATSRR